VASLRRTSLALADRSPSRWALFAVLLIVSFYPIVAYQDNAYPTQSPQPANDYYYTIWKPGHTILQGRNPYPAPDSPSLAGSDNVYPPVVFEVASPLSLVPFSFAKWVWIALLALASAGTFVLVGVRDVRGIAVAMLSAPIVSGLMWGNATLLVGLAAALAWHYRDRPRHVAAAYACGAAIKVLLLPLGVWLLFTGRGRALARGIAIFVALLVVAWVGISFDGLRDYPALLHTLSDHWISHGLFVSALLASHGWGSTAAVLVGALPALAMFGVAWWLRQSDAAVFGLTLIAILYLTPVNHTYNLELMLVAIACVHPRLSPVWLLFPLTWWTTWSSPLQHANPDWLVAYAVTLSLVAAVSIALAGHREITDRAKLLGTAPVQPRTPVVARPAPGIP
jgi:hypothetical protein